MKEEYKVLASKVIHSQHGQQSQQHGSVCLH